MRLADKAVVVSGAATLIALLAWSVSRAPGPSMLPPIQPRNHRGCNQHSRDS